MKRIDNSRLPRRSPLSVAFVFVALGTAYGALVAEQEGRTDDEKTNPGRGSAAAESKLRITDIKWGGNSFGALPIIVGANAQAWLERGVNRSGELIPLLDNADSFVAAHVVLTELWRVEKKEGFSISTSSGYLVVYNGLHVRLEWKNIDGEFTQTVIVLDEVCQRKRLSDWWKARFRDHPLEFSSKTVVRSAVQNTDRSGATGNKPSLNDIDWTGRSDVQVRLSTNPTSNARGRGVDNSSELLPLLDDADTFVAAHVVLTDLWRVRYKEDRWVPVSAGYFVHYNGLHVRIEWKDIQGSITKTISIPDEECQRKRVAAWWRARFRDYPQEFSSKTPIE